MGLISELRRRNVLRMAVLYVVAAWLVMQVAGVLMDLGAVPVGIGPWVLVVMVIGLPIALVFSWLFEITPEGLALEKDVPEGASITHITGRRMDFIVIAVLSAGLILFAYDKWWSRDPLELSIAVLPFVNMSDDPGNEFFSDGVSEEIINLLTQVPDLMVISRSSAFSFKGQGVDIPTIADRLNVAHVLEGSVRRSGDQLRITAQLIEVETDVHLWSETYDRELENIFAIQDEIAAAVVDELKIRLLDDLPKSSVTSPEAYALYLQGRRIFDRGTAASVQQAEILLKEALEIDPGFAPAWAELGFVYERQSAFYGRRSVDEGNELARRAAQKALLINPQYGPAYAALARVEMFYDWDFKAASQNLQQAMDLNPSGAAILLAAARLHAILGHLDEAISLHRQSITLDPVSAAAHYRLGRALHKAHRLDEALDSFRMALSLSPGRDGAHASIAEVLLAQGDATAALVAIEQEASFWRLPGIAKIHHALGNDEASDAALQELIDRSGEYLGYQIAQVYAFRGEINLAFDWLNQSYEDRDGGLTHLLSDPWLASLHDDPRWEALLKKIGLPH